MGRRQDNVLKRNPELALAYGLYQDCKQVQLVFAELPGKSNKGNQTRVSLSPYPTGYHTLPEAGGMLDQPYRTMEFFSYFMAGEHEAYFEKLK